MLNYKSEYSIFYVNEEEKCVLSSTILLLISSQLILSKSLLDRYSLSKKGTKIILRKRARIASHSFGMKHQRTIVVKTYIDSIHAPELQLHSYCELELRNYPKPFKITEYHKSSKLVPSHPRNLATWLKSSNSVPNSIRVPN
jgi:hypothetical protein